MSPSSSGFFGRMFSRSSSDRQLSRKNSGSKGGLDSTLRRGHTKSYSVSSNALASAAQPNDIQSAPSTPLHTTSMSTSASNASPSAADEASQSHPLDRQDPQDTVTPTSAAPLPRMYSNTAPPNRVAAGQGYGYGYGYATSMDRGERSEHPIVVDPNTRTEDAADDDILANATVSTAGGLGLSLSATSLSSSYLNQFVQQQQQYAVHHGSQPHYHRTATDYLYDPTAEAYGTNAPGQDMSSMYDPTISPQHSELGLVLESCELSEFDSKSPSTRFHAHQQQQHQLLSTHNLPRLPQINTSGHPTNITATNVQDPSLDQQFSHTLPAVRRTTQGGSLLASQIDMYNSTQAQHGYPQSPTRQYNPNQQQLQQQQLFQQTGNLSIPSSLSSSMDTTDLDTKRAFTQFHNMPQYAIDSTSPFLGEEGNVSSYGGHPMSMMHIPMTASASVGALSGSRHALSDRITGVPASTLLSSASFQTMDEHHISINSSMRLLKPVEGTDKWQEGRRYLIAPAALAACPLSVVSTLAGPQAETLHAATSDDAPHLFGMIDLGEALMTYIGEKHHLSLGKWSRCRLVLQQNYLLEYDLSTPVPGGRPRGFAHLECAVAYPHDKFADSFELNFYASPCAKADQRVLMIRVPKREDRDRWIQCLNDAAQLRIADLYDYDERLMLGNGRYANIFPARRKTNRFHGNDRDELSSMDLTSDDRQKIQQHCDCALKIVDKSQFWKRVVQGRERADTLVREVSVQATLTAKARNDSMRTPTFLKIMGVVETSQNLVIELELLEGTDLFQHIFEKRSIAEQEAARIMEDILSSVAIMSRAGLAHRDIKPANILMCDRTGIGEVPNTGGSTVKVGDFGMSTFVGVDGLVRGRCGTPGYVAPEIFTTGTRAGYGNKVDVFSSGVTLYILLCGYEPFYGETEEALIEANKRGKIKFHGNEWKQVSDEAKALIKSMCQPDPAKRCSAVEALSHPWMMRHRQGEQNPMQRVVQQGKSGTDERSNGTAPSAACCIS